ncbi:hypothetical protein LXM25_03455 [Dyadobacter sp. LJ53]|uniref:hypothetical protein n=1 Tax=Dyadobacter chenwenxiniae TaxID=2906456 RepID=UPI001F29277D|nr:hypothetical protein [Dyadobacter chenwenxiniae]MCF0049100.1 hypothetical protein [Dyadobacter chenwenxiniae]
MNEQSIVRVTIQEIFRINGYLDTDLMTQRNFEQISDEIEKKSGIYISGTTIKRLSKGAFNRSPQIATLNALATYFNFNSWPEYKNAFIQQHLDKSHAVGKQQADLEAQPAASDLSKMPWHRKALARWVPLLLVFVCICSYYLYPSKGPENDFALATFSSRKTTNNDLPNTVIFDYNIEHIAADSFFIQQSWDKNRKVRIDKHKNTLTDIYYEPGYHIAKLIANDSVIKTTVVNIPTDKWVFYSNEYKRRYRTKYIKTENASKKGSLAITQEELVKNKIDINQENIYLYSYFPSKHEVNSDDFTLKTRVRANAVRNSLCPYIAIEVYGQQDVILIKSTSKGCANQAKLRFGTHEINGNETDLSSVSYDVTKWTEVELQVKDKQVSIKIAGRQVFTTSYQNSIKLITGLSFISNGLCEVDQVTLTGPDGEIFCKDNFDS